MKKAKIAIAALSIAGALGVIAMPLSSYAATDTGSVTVTVNVGSNLSISLDASSSSSLSIDAGALVDGSSSTNRIQHVLKAHSNSSTGYKLTIQDADNDTALKSTNNSSIPSVAGTDAALTAGTAGWGWQVVATADASATNKWNAIPANGSATAFYTGSAQTAAVDETKIVRFGVATDTDQMSGAYTDAIIYTIMAN